LGTWRGARGSAVSPRARRELTVVGTGCAGSAGRRGRDSRVAAELGGRVRDIRRDGAASLELCAVAAGWLDAYFEHGRHRWDWAAGALIAAEAGAFVSLPGEAPDLGTDATYAASPSVAGPLRELLGQCGAADV